MSCRNLSRPSGDEVLCAAAARMVSVLADGGSPRHEPLSTTGGADLLPPSPPLPSPLVSPSYTCERVNIRTKVIVSVFFFKEMSSRLGAFSAFPCAGGLFSDADTFVMKPLERALRSTRGAQGATLSRAARRRGGQAGHAPRMCCKERLAHNTT